MNEHALKIQLKQILDKLSHIEQRLSFIERKVKADDEDWRTVVDCKSRFSAQTTPSWAVKELIRPQFDGEK